MPGPQDTFFYTNQVSISTSPWDISFLFQVIAPSREDKPDGTMTITGIPLDQRTVAMSPQHAKLMLALLHTNITEYEKVAGRIPLDRDSQNKYDQFIQAVKSVR